MLYDAISMEGYQQGGGKSYIINSASYITIIYGYMDVNLLTIFYLLYLADRPWGIFPGDFFIF